MFEKKIPYILLFCYIVYFGQIYIPSLKLLSSICALVAVGICCYYFLKILLLKEKYSLIVVGLLGLSLSFLLSFALAQDKSRAIAYLKDLVLANFVFFPSYYLSRKGELNERFFKLTFIFLLIFNIYNYFESYQRIVLESILGSTDIVNNVGYNILLLLPLVLFFKKDYLKFLFISIITFFVISSVKRGAIIILAICLSLFVLYFFKSIPKSHKNNWIYYLSLVIVIAVGGYYLMESVVQNDFLIRRFTELSEGNSSGRDLLFQRNWDMFWSNDNIFRYLFGYGLGGTWIFSGNLAHNDWLEILVNNGLIGVFFFLLFFIGCLREYKEFRHSRYHFVLLVVFTILFVRTLFSQSFIDPASFPLLLIVGYVLGRKMLLNSLHG